MYPLSRSREIGISFTEHRLWRFVNGELQSQSAIALTFQVVSGMTDDCLVVSVVIVPRILLYV